MKHEPDPNPEVLFIALTVLIVVFTVLYLVTLFSYFISE